MNHPWCFEPDMRVKLEAYLPDGTTREVLNTDLPQSNTQDNYPISLACAETKGQRNIVSPSLINTISPLKSLRLFTAARKTAGSHRPHGYQEASNGQAI